MGYGDSQFQLSDSTKQEKNQMRLSDLHYRQQDPAVQEATRREGTYHLTKELTQGQLDTLDRRNKYQKKKKFSSIRQTIREKISRNIYRKYDSAVTDTDMDAQQRKLKLHHALGQKFIDEGKNVLEIDVAGSGFERFRKEYTGFKGKDKEDLTEGRAEARADRLADFAGVWKYNILKRYLIKRSLMKMGDSGENDEHLKEVYGEEYQAALDKKTKFRYRRKSETTSEGLERTRYSLSGPLALKGALDNGEFKIENLKSYVLNMVQDYIYEHMVNGKLEHELVINLQGHSRGGVAVGVATHALSEWLSSSDCDAFRDQVKINLIQRDPVPGPDSRHVKDHGKMDLRVPAQGGGYTNDPHINVTSLVSFHTDHTVFFRPQNVRGQQRIVVMQEKHSVGMDQVDGTQKDANGMTKWHEMAGIDAATMEAYRGSGYSELRNGVWLMDEDNVLVRVRSYGEAMDVLRKVNSKTITQADRHQVVADMIKNWFIDNDFVDENVTADEYKEDLRSKVQLEDEIAKPDKMVKESEEMKRVRTATAMFRQVMDLKCNTEGEFAAFIKTKNMAIDEAIEACKNYMEKRTPLTDKLVDEHLEKISKLLSIYRQEKAYLESMDDLTFGEYQQKGSPVMKTYLDWLNK